MPKFSKGFTIIELIVVIAIIAALSAIVLVNVGKYTNNAKDAARKSALVEMQKALNIYYGDHGSYPSTGGAQYWRGICNNYKGFCPAGDCGLSGPNGYIPDLAPTYIAQLAVDPNGNNAGAADCEVAGLGCYLYSSNGVNYKLMAYCTPSKFSERGEPFYDPHYPNTAYALCSDADTCENW